MPDDRVFESSPKVVRANDDVTTEGRRPSFGVVVERARDALLPARDDVADPVKIGLISLPEHSYAFLTEERPVNVQRYLLYKHRIFSITRITFTKRQLLRGTFSD